jgi:hypothetical protein
MPFSGWPNDRKQAKVITYVLVLTYFVSRKFEHVDNKMKWNGKLPHRGGKKWEQSLVLCWGKFLQVANFTCQGDRWERDWESKASEQQQSSLRVQPRVGLVRFFFCFSYCSILFVFVN